MEAVRPGAVVIVDDDPAVLASLEFLLQASGYEVVAYASPAEFLRDGADRAACLVVDHQMPEMTGLELIARLREDAQITPALLISSAVTAAVRARASELGVLVLLKPLEEDDLLRFVAAHASRGEL
jgi:two-component system response regulator FixJ